MNMARVSIILGTRPQIIKSAPVYEALVAAGVECDIVNTGQHFEYEMNRQFFSELHLPPPSADLNIGAGSPNEQIASIIEGLGHLFANSKPDLAIVPGDTNSALAAGLACSKTGVEVAHLESGCRSNDIHMAEEVNRRILDHSSQMLLCPTAGCVKNVNSEHVLADVIANVGDTMYDSLLKLKPALEMIDVETKYRLEEGAFAFMTLHRAETVDEKSTLRDLLAEVDGLGLRIAFSVHPRTRDRIEEFGLKPGPNLQALEPLPYLESLALVSRSKFVITDSGGLQKEAYWLGKPTLITRDSTEWGEIVRAGGAFLVGTNPSKIASGYKRAGKVNPKVFRESRRIFGSGKASGKVTRMVSRYLGRLRNGRN
jgi:UDP-N-acetylglucosamine 2-epimerase